MGFVHKRFTIRGRQSRCTVCQRATRCINNIIYIYLYAVSPFGIRYTVHLPRMVNLLWTKPIRYVSSAPHVRLRRVSVAPTRCPRGIYVEEKEKLESLVAPAPIAARLARPARGACLPRGRSVLRCYCASWWRSFASFVPGRGGAAGPRLVGGGGGGGGGGRRGGAEEGGGGGGRCVPVRVTGRGVAGRGVAPWILWVCGEKSIRSADS